MSEMWQTVEWVTAVPMWIYHHCGRSVRLLACVRHGAPDGSWVVVEVTGAVRAEDRDTLAELKASGHAVIVQIGEATDFGTCAFEASIMNAIPINPGDVNRIGQLSIAFRPVASPQSEVDAPAVVVDPFEQAYQQSLAAADDDLKAIYDLVAWPSPVDPPTSEWLFTACGLDIRPAVVDPLDVEHDGVSLRMLLELDEGNRREPDNEAVWSVSYLFTPAQRAAISAHWSAELRAKVGASKAADAERERRQVTIDMEDD